MKILFVSDDFPPYNQGGSGISTSLVVKQLSKKHQSYVLTKKCNEKKWFFHKALVLPVLNKAESQNSSIKEVILFGINIFVKIIHDYITISKFVKNNEVDLINITPMSYSSALQIIAVSFMGKPVVVDVRDLFLTHTLSYLGKFRSNPRKRTRMLIIFFNLITFIEELVFLLQTGILKLMTKSGFFKIHYIALSNFIKTELINHGYSENKISVVYNISELKPKRKLTNGRKNQIIFAGRIESEKGIWVAIKAWELINDPLFHLLFVGEGSRLTELKEYVRNKGIKNVDFLGKISNKDVIKNYKRSKIIIAPSIWPEAFGRFIQESISSSTPLVTTKVGGIPEGIKHKVTGMLVEPNNPKQLAEAVLELLSNKRLYSKIVKNLEKEPARYSPEKIGNERLELYKRFI